MRNDWSAVLNGTDDDDGWGFVPQTFNLSDMIHNIDEYVRMGVEQNPNLRPVDGKDDDEDYWEEEEEGEEEEEREENLDEHTHEGNQDGGKEKNKQKQHQQQGQKEDEGSQEKQGEEEEEEDSNIPCMFDIVSWDQFFRKSDSKKRAESAGGAWSAQVVSMYT
jgi:hypothetical protein